MTKPNVYVSRSVRPEVLARLGKVCEVRTWSGPGRCPAEVLTREGAGVEAILGTDRWTAAMLGEASRLRLIALTAVGFDMVDVAAATARGVLVTNTPDVLTETVADLTFALLLAAARRVCEGWADWFGPAEGAVGAGASRMPRRPCKGMSKFRSSPDSPRTTTTSRVPARFFSLSGK